MPQTAPSKKPAAKSPAAGPLLCPSCQGNEFTERSSFKTTTEPLLGAVSTSVTVDLMNCKRCGADLPAVRGRRQYSLVGKERLATLVADLDEAKRVNSEMVALIDTMAKRSQGLSVEIDRTIARGEISVMRARVSALEEETSGLEERRDRLARTLVQVAASIPAATR